MLFEDIFKSPTWSLEHNSKASYGPSAAWSNRDMDPVPPNLRTWTTWNYIAYWVSDATNVAMWQLASSMLAIGLSWREALTAIAIGHTIIAVVVVLNGTVGARLHISFAVLNRSSFGFWFSYFSVVSRAVLAMFWFGIQTYTGSECVYQMLKAIWPSIARIHNRLPESTPITTVGMMCYFLYWLLQFPLMFVSPQKIRHLFTAKSIIVPFAWLAILIWAMVKAPPRVSLSPKHTQLTGSSLSWAWLSALNSSLGFYATVAVNIPDFTRYAKNEHAQYVQLFIIPTAFTLVGFAGIAVTSAGEVLYNEILWDPLHLIDRWDNRAAAFFASFSFLLSIMGANISANSLSAANDLMALFPKYINIRRGQIICAILGGWALCPWEILASAPGFLSFMSGYTVFLGPFAGIIGSFTGVRWMFQRCTILVGGTGTGKELAVISLLCSVTPNLPGLAQSINPEIHVGGIAKLFSFAWLYGFFSAALIYWVTSVWFPAKETYLDHAILADDVPGQDLSLDTKS